MDSCGTPTHTRKCGKHRAARAHSAIGARAGQAVGAVYFMRGALALRAAYAEAFEQCRNRVDRYRPREQETLRLDMAERGEPRNLLFGLGAFDHHREPERTREIDD